MKLKRLFLLAISVFALSAINVNSSTPNSFGFIATQVQAAEVNTNDAPIIIDGYVIKNPEQVTAAIFSTRVDETFIFPDGSLNIRLHDNITVDFDYRFSNLESIMILDIFPENYQQSQQPLTISVSASTPSLKLVNLNYRNGYKSHECRPTTVYCDLNNLSLDKLIVDQSMGIVSYINTTVSNFSINPGGTVNLGTYATLINATICTYDCLLTHWGFPEKEPFRIESGYFAIDPNATLIDLGQLKHAGYGGYYTQEFKDNLASRGVVYPAPSYEWYQTGREDFPWMIRKIEAIIIDGVPILYPDRIYYLTLNSNIEKSYLSSEEYGGILNLKIYKDIDVVFDERFSSLMDVQCRYVFNEATSDIGHDITMNILFVTTSIRSVLINVDTPAKSVTFDSEIDLNFDFNGQKVRHIYSQRNNDGQDDVLYTTFSNFVSEIDPISLSTDNGTYLISHNTEIVNCTFNEYKSLEFSSATCKVTSGYFDYNSVNSDLEFSYLDGCATGGYYTDAFKQQANDSTKFVANGYQFYPTVVEDYTWTINDYVPPLSPTDEEIQRDLDNMTTMEDGLPNSFAFKIAYSYNYPGMANKFQIQMCFDYEGIMDYCLSVAKRWGKDGFGPSDSLCIHFYTSDPNNYISYDLIQDKVFKYSSGVSIVDSNPQLPDGQFMRRGFKVFTLDLGDLLGEDRENITREINPTLFFRIVDQRYGLSPTLHEFYSSLHRANTDSSRENAIDYSFSYLLDRYLSMPLYRRNESLLKCKKDLGL